MTTDPVEIMQRALARDWWDKGLSDYETVEEQVRDWMVPLFAAQRIAVMQALEAAGYRIAGPEPTEEILAYLKGRARSRSAMHRHWKDMHSKLPLYGSE